MADRKTPNFSPMYFLSQAAKTEVPDAIPDHLSNFTTNALVDLIDKHKKIDYHMGNGAGQWVKDNMDQFSPTQRYQLYDMFHGLPSIPMKDAIDGGRVPPLDNSQYPTPPGQ